VRTRVDRTVDSIRRRRAEALALIGGYPNVVGSMIGLKVAGGRRTRTVGLTVFVSRKMPLASLSRGKRLPNELQVGGISIPVDVIQMGPLRNQSGLFPAQGALVTYDGAGPGTLSCLCRSGDGLFGLTCAHALKGKDGDPTTPTPVSVWSPTMRRYESVGQSLRAVTGPGAGVPGRFGFVDAAIFSVEHPELAAMGASATPTGSVEASIGTKLHGFGAMRGRRTGVVLGVDQVLFGVRCDYVVSVDPPGTYRGDSGLLWRNSAGDPVAIHAKAPKQGALISAAMSAVRAEGELEVEFLSKPS